MKGLIHIYTGEGKGKTSSSIGLAIRAVGNELPVVFSQFMKDGLSGEIKILKQLPNITVLHAKEKFGFYRTLSEEQKKEALYYNTELLKESIEKAVQLARNNIDEDKPGSVLILDEAIGAYNFSLLDREMLLDVLNNKPDNLELVLTGRSPAKELIEKADYVSEIQAVKHPYSKGIAARKGIEL